MSNLTVTTTRTESIKFNNLNTSAITINSDGTVRTPTAPCVYAYRDITPEAWENFGSTPTLYNFNNVQLNVGNCYNGTTGVFTCPIEGVYAVSYGFLCGGASVSSAVAGQIYKNGVNVTFNGVHANCAGASASYNYSSATFLIPCFKNDYLQIYVQTGNIASIYSKEHCHMSIWMYN